ncbi:hypothetical protein GALMADRAFT_413274 [Galerina marginata CBS 339.88]|uniref:Uncharacterized protein n=1 Tax=Galerina marginata (strain CBS 339.88) TaxID=685588 RepID=A0A067T614_GALM3|nr:hypothetical protein GALMADRAFT_413274 [Galerina marginata CBS 339.88]
MFHMHIHTKSCHVLALDSGRAFNNMLPPLTEYIHDNGVHICSQNVKILDCTCHPRLSFQHSPKLHRRALELRCRCTSSTFFTHLFVIRI